MPTSPSPLSAAVARLIRRQRVLVPPQFRPFLARFRQREFSLLDVGCGNHSASIARRWFPRVRYFGLDRAIYNNDQADLALMEEFYTIDLSHDSLEPVPRATFDLIIANHVIEHLPNGDTVLAALAERLRPGGYLYVEFPGPRSLSLPSMAGTLNFCDDPTHVRIFDAKEVANILLANGLHIRRGGTRRDWRRILLLPVTLPLTAIKGNPAVALWDLCGFADYVLAQRPASSGA